MMKIKVITRGWMLKGPDWDQGENVKLSGWLGWRIHANEFENSKPVTIIEDHVDQSK